MKLIKKIIAILAVSVVCLGAYLFLGGIDTERPAPPDFGLGVERVGEDDNWFTALVAVTNLVSLNEEEGDWVWRASRGDTNAFTTARLDAVLARHGELFRRLGANVNRRGWQHPVPETKAEQAALALRMDDRALLNGNVVQLLDLKIQRELDQGEFMFAFADLRVLVSMVSAGMRGAENVIACEVAAVQLRKTMRRFLVFVAQLDADQLKELQQMLDALANDFIANYALAYAREVGTVEARFEWMYRRGGAEQMQENLSALMKSFSAKLLDKSVVGFSQAAFKLPNFNAFSFHFNRSLAGYYEESAKIYDNLLRGKYDIPIRALRVQTPDVKWKLPIYPNWIGRVMCASLPAQGAKLCLWEAAGLFVVSADRVVVAANRYRVDHAEYPKELQQLVPEYLDAVPMDPFGDGAIGFNAAQGTVHSVAENGGFDGVIPSDGAKAMHFTNADGVRRWYTPYIRRLDGQPVR